MALSHERSKANKWKCNLCSFSTPYNAKLVIHMRIHTGLKPFACYICKYVSNNAGNLNRHKRTHTDQQPFPCQFCKQKFSLEQNRTRHETTCQQNPKQLDKTWLQKQKVFKCELCKYSTLTRSQLKGHAMTHTKVNPFSCNFCSYSTTTCSSLNIHIRTHTGEKPYKCDICSYACGAKSTLNVHKMRHAKQKPYKCPHCDYTATAASSIPRHINARHNKGVRPKRFSCKICSKKYYTQADLRKHNKVAHHGDEDMPHKCQYCKSGFVLLCRKMYHEASCKANSDRDGENERLCREHGITCQIKISLARLKVYTYKNRDEKTPTTAI